jgi:catechol 2,3-dioxygenase-like lactoylglutathione lyase family enzyme
MPDTFPAQGAVVLDATNARTVAEFYRALLGYDYRAGDEAPPAGQPDPHGDDWLVLRDRTGAVRLAVQQVDELPTSTWPAATIPQQLHLDLTVPNIAELATQRDRALSFGATILQDRSGDPEEPLYVFADPAGHPFCIFVSPEHPDGGAW